MQRALMDFYSNVFILSKDKDLFCFGLRILLSTGGFFQLTQGLISGPCKEFSPDLAVSLELALLVPSFGVLVKLTTA